MSRSFWTWLLIPSLALALPACVDIDDDADTPDVHVDEPDTNVIDPPDTNIINPPDVNVDDGPDVNVQDGPDVNVQDPPDVNVQESPDVNIQPPAGNSGTQPNSNR